MLHPGSPVSSVNLGDQPVGFTGYDCADMPPLLGRRIFPTFPKPSLNRRQLQSFGRELSSAENEQEAEYLRKRGLLTAIEDTKSMVKSVHELSAVIYDLRI
jgi:hypothetical protein